MPLADDRQKIAHLLRRFAFGASETEIDYYGQDGLQGAIDRLLDYQSVDEGFNLGFEDLRTDKGAVKMRAVQGWWLLRMVETRRPLQEKMTLFWHDHFATSASKVDIAPAMYNQNETLRANATGRFQDLLLAISKDPAMLYWLDNNTNVKGKPNENFAREVMELFTLGIGNYTEKDIQEAARAFTGWTYAIRQRISPPKPVRNAQFMLREEQHDDGLKTVLGNSGPLDGETVIGILCGNPRTSVLLTTKIWEWFAYPNPEPALVNRLASRFRDNGLDIRKLLLDVMQAPEFYSDRAVRAVYKNPIDFCISTVRQLGIGKNLIDRNTPDLQRKLSLLAPMQFISRSTKAMGMELFYPPDVSGWDGGQAWISSATMVERIKWADTLFGGQGAKGSFRYPIASLIGDSSPEEAARKLVSVFDAYLPPAKVSQLEAAARAAASNGRVTNANAQAVAVSVCRLIFGSPEFQFA